MKKHKKEKKHKHDKKRRDPSSSSETNSSDEEWVEANSKGNESSRESASSSRQNDNWLDLPSTFVPTYNKDFRDRKENRGKHRKDDKKTASILEQPGTHSRELNPYWKEGGKGLPEDKNPDLHLPEHAVGDSGLSWLRKAYRRVKDQAEEEGRTMEDVARERWGSLEKLESMLSKAEIKAFGTPVSSRSREKYDKYSKGSRELDRSTRKSDSDSSFSSSRNERAGCFRKPGDENEYIERFVPQTELHKSDETRRNWMKKKVKESEPKYEVTVNAKMLENASSSVTEASSKLQTPVRHPVVEANDKDVCMRDSSDTSGGEHPSKILSDKEMNDLGAKLVKAELFGNTQLVDKLKAQLENARKAREGINDIPNRQNPSSSRRETVTLTRTDHKGFTFPLTQPEGLEESSGRRNKKIKMHDTEGKRVKYFPDDDKYSLKQLFEQEKMTTVEDHNALFSQLAGKISGKTSSVCDEYMDRAASKQTEHRKKELDRTRAINEHKHFSSAVERCHFCLDNLSTKKHLIVAFATKTYLSLPSYESLTEGSCLIVPMAHIASATLLDEDVWNEVQLFRKSLTKMFEEEDKDVIFMETSMHLKRHLHTVIECIPVPKEIGDMAPIYFKKAIQESESEWALNKQLIDLSKKDVRHSVPQGLPYFSVDFGLQGGFAHVIEDEKIFPTYFGKEIIGGMLDCDVRLWRKPRQETFEDHKKKVLRFSKMWKPYNWTERMKD